MEEAEAVMEFNVNCCFFATSALLENGDVTMLDVEGESDVCGVWCWAGMVAGMKGGNEKIGGKHNNCCGRIAIKFNCCTYNCN